MLLVGSRHSGDYVHPSNGMPTPRQSLPHGIEPTVKAWSDPGNDNAGTAQGNLRQPRFRQMQQASAEQPAGAP